MLIPWLRSFATFAPSFSQNLTFAEVHSKMLFFDSFGSYIFQFHPILLPSLLREMFLHYVKVFLCNWTSNVLKFQACVLPLEDFSSTIMGTLELTNPCKSVTYRPSTNRGLSYSNEILLTLVLTRTIVTPNNPICHMFILSIDVPENKCYETHDHCFLLSQKLIQKKCQPSH